MNQLVFISACFALRQLLRPVLAVNCSGSDSSSTFSGPRIYTANHPSTLDPLHLIPHLPLPVCALISQDIFSLPVIGSFLKLIGYIPVDGSQGHLAYSQALSALKSGRSLLIFPEGHLSRSNGQLKPFFSGAIRLALETNTPIIPVGISHKDGHVVKKDLNLNSKPNQARFFLRGNYHINFGPPLHLSGPINPDSIAYHKKNLSRKISSLAL